MAFQYGAELLYSLFSDEDDEESQTSSIPILLFNVTGGASRVIDLRTTNDISLASELEQSRSFKNINLGMPPTNGGKDMKATVDLTNAADKKEPFSINFRIWKWANGKLIEGLSLYSPNAVIKKTPQITQGYYLKMEFSLSDVTLERITNPGKKPKRFSF